MATELFIGYGFLVPTLEIYDFLQIDRLPEVDPQSESEVYLDIQKHYLRDGSPLAPIQPWVQHDVDMKNIMLVWSKTITAVAGVPSEVDGVVGNQIENVPIEEARKTAGEYADSLGIQFWREDPNILTYEDYADAYLGGHVTEPLF